jgi:hypothetical protein
MRESRTYGSARGVPSNGRPYRHNSRISFVLIQSPSRNCDVSTDEETLCKRSS